MGLIFGNQKEFNIEKSINALHHNNRIKNENHMINKIDVETAFEKIMLTSMIKKCQ